MDLTLPAILRRAELLHGAPADAVRCGTLSWSYADLARASRALAAGLAARGLAPGDRVALLHHNCHRFMAAALGAVEGGLVLVPLNLRLDAPTLAAMLRDSGARALLVEPATRELGAEAAAQAGDVPVWDAAAVDGDPGSPGAVTPRAADVAQIYYTSGTTGGPRGVMLTHGNIASHALMTVAELGLHDADVWAHVAPMFHLADAWSVFAVTWVGGRHVMFPRLDPPEVLAGLAGLGVTMTNLVPTMLNRLVSHPTAVGRSFPSLRRIMSGGAPIAPALVRRVVETFGCEYVQTYGLTETSPYLTFSLPRGAEVGLPAEERLRLACRTGRPALGVELRVVGEDGADVPRDDLHVGEIRVRAPWVTPGYWNRPRDTADAFADGWLLTGDLATCDASGSVNIVDRRKDMIITGGEKVFSVEVEQALAAHPAVDECAVVGVPDADWGERVAAAVVPRAGGVDAGELAGFLRGRLAHFKVPKEIVFLESLPKTGSGKIRKVEIRRQLAEGGR